MPRSFILDPSPEPLLYSPPAPRFTFSAMTRLPSIPPSIRNSAFALASLLGLSTLVAPARADRLYSAWLQEYDPLVNYSQGAKAVATDARGNVIVSGFAKDSSDVNNGYFTAKYDALDGHQVWAVVFRPPGGSATPNAVVVDSAGDVIVTGTATIAGTTDAYTVKYSGVDGAFVWKVQYNGTASGQDEGIKVAVDANDDVIITARSQGDNGNSTGLDFYTAKYGRAAGNLIWADRYTTASSRNDIPAGLVVDGSSNTIVVGASNTGSGVFSFYLRKLNSNGTLAWEKTLDSGGAGGATAVAVDSSDNVFATGLFTNASGHHGYYTVKYSAAGIFQWTKLKTPPSQNFIGTATSIAVGPDGNPVVTGFLKNSTANAEETAYTEKYSSTNGGALLGAITDNGFAIGDTRARQLIVDGSSNTIIVGETDVPVNPNGNSGNSTDLYLAKYDAGLTKVLYTSTFGGNAGSDDTGNAIALDGNGSVALVGTAFRKVPSVGYTKLVTIKYNRFIAAKGDELPDDPGVPVDALFATGNAPAVSNTGAVAALIGATSGKKKLSAIFTQSTAGGSFIPAVQAGTAPGITGAKFASFADPIVAPNGRYAFAGKVSGVPGSQASGVWTNLSGTLQPVLQQGKPVPGLTENLASVMSLALRNTQLLALVKLAAPGKTNVALVGINAANAGTKLLRTGDAVTVNTKASTIKTLIVLSPTVTSPGDGRWQGDTSTVVLATLADKRTVIYRVNPAGVSAPMLFTEGDAAAATGLTGAKWKGFGKPGISGVGSRYVVLGTLAPLAGTVTPANDTALVHSNNGTTFTAFAEEGGSPNDPGLNTLTYTGFSDPLVNSNAGIGFIGTLKGTGVKPADSKVLFFGPFGGTYKNIARLGKPATDSAGDPDTALWSSFTSIALSEGTGGAPIFVAKLSGAGVNGKNSLGIWGVDSTGAVRRLLRTGDVLGTQTVASFNLLKALPTVFTAARSFNNAGAVAVQVTFTDKTQALLKIGLP